MKKTIIYFAPHQDDELLSMGIALCISLREGKDVHVVLCSDGSKSKVRFKLRNGQPCEKHEGIHCYDLSEEEFTKARDREFQGSCEALGVKRENIHIPEKRAVDGSLSDEEAKEIVERALQEIDPHAEVCTIYPNGSSQHKDHTALGRAVMSLYEEGTIEKVSFFLEPYCVKQSLKEDPSLKLAVAEAGLLMKQKIKKAIASYSLWKPEEGRYAIGYHSVTDDFDNYIRELKNYRVEGIR